MIQFTVLRRTVPVLLLASFCLGWSAPTVYQVAWTAVDFFPPDVASLVRRHDDRFEAGIRRGLASPPAWRAGSPGSLKAAFEAQVQKCANDLRRPVPMDDLVEEIGVLAVRVLDANDPLAVAHGDEREASYAADYQQYVDTIKKRLRLVYYGQDRELIVDGAVHSTVSAALTRSQELYPFVGQEFYRTGALRDWRVFDDRSVTFGVAAVSLSRGLTDLANLTAFIWRQGGGLVPTPRPTPTDHIGPTVTLTPLQGGFPNRGRSGTGTPVMPKSKINLPSP